MVRLKVPLDARLVAVDESFGNLAGFTNIRRARIQTDGPEGVAQELDARSGFFRPIMQQRLCLSFHFMVARLVHEVQRIVTEEIGETRSWQMRDATYADRRAGSIDDMVSPVENSVTTAAGLGAPPFVSIRAA